MPNKRVNFKVGTSFRTHVGYTPAPDIAPETLEDVTVTSQVRTSEGALIGTLTATLDDDFMGFTLNAEDGTGDWPAGSCVEWDIKFEHDDFGIFYTETVDLKLTRKVTA